MLSLKCPITLFVMIGCKLRKSMACPLAISHLFFYPFSLQFNTLLHSSSTIMIDAVLDMI